MDPCRADAAHRMPPGLRLVDGDGPALQLRKELRLPAAGADMGLRGDPADHLSMLVSCDYDQHLSHPHSSGSPQIQTFTWG